MNEFIYEKLRGVIKSRQRDSGFERRRLATTPKEGVLLDIAFLHGYIPQRQAKERLA
jgi:hypothetical protein